MMADPKPKTEEKAKSKEPSAYDKTLIDMQGEIETLKDDLEKLTGDFKRLCKSHGFVF